MTLRSARLAVLAAFLCTANVAAAQEIAVPPPMPELRADAIVGHQPAAQLGAGLQLAMGYYARLGVVAAGGVRLDDVTPRADARMDVLVRFLLDPFRQAPYGLSLGGGLGVRAEPGDRVRPVLLLALELEGRRSAGGWVPAVQAGLGGGVRIGLLARRGAAIGR